MYRLLLRRIVQEGHIFVVLDLVKRSGLLLPLRVHDILLSILLWITVHVLNVSQVYFESEDVHACIVTCGGLCPGLNTVIREIVCGLYHMYGVHKVLGIEVSKRFCHYLKLRSRSLFGFLGSTRKWKVECWQCSKMLLIAFFLIFFSFWLNFLTSERRPTLWFYDSTLVLVITLFVIVLKKECIIIQYWLKGSFCTYREVTEVFMLEIQFLWHQRWWMTSINVVAPSLGHHVEAMIPLKLLTAFRTGELIRLICLPFLIHTSDHILHCCIYLCKLIPYVDFFSSF